MLLLAAARMIWRILLTSDPVAASLTLVNTPRRTHCFRRVGQALLGASVALLALTAVTIGRAEPQSVAQREASNLARSEFALAAQAAAGPLGDLSFTVPLPTGKQTPVVDGVLDEGVWSEATEVPLPCVRRAAQGRIVADARLLALRADGRVFVALALPARTGAATLLSFEPTALSKPLSVRLQANGSVTGTPENIGRDGQPELGLKSAAARVGDVLVVELELVLPAGEIVIVPHADALGLRPPHPLAEPKVRFIPDNVAWRLRAADGQPGQRAWSLAVDGEGLPAAAIAVKYASCRGFRQPAAGGEAQVSVDGREGRSHFAFRVPAALGATLLKITTQSMSCVEIKDGWRRFDTPKRELDPQFAAPEFDDGKWGPTTILNQDDPKHPIERPWVHYRVHFTMPEDQQGRRKSLFLNKIDDHAWVYVNGNFVGEHHRYDTPYRADVTDLVRAGDNLLAILIKNDQGPGGLVGRVAVEDDNFRPYALACAAFLPDLEQLLDRIRPLETDSELQPAVACKPRLEQLNGRLENLRSPLGTEDSLEDWDETFRQALSLRRQMVLSSPLLDFQRLVFVKRRNFGGHDAFFGYTSYLKRPPAELCVLESVREGLATRTLLQTDGGCIRDPDVSFDGRRVLLAYARDQQDTYHIYEIGADGEGLRQLTTSPPYSGAEPAPRNVGFQDVEPCYLPSGDIAFGSTRYVRFVDCVGQGEPVTILFVMDADGGRLRGISANHVHDWHPSVLNDGRIIYTRWEYTDRSQMWSHQLFVKNPDGSGNVNFYGSNSWWPVSMLHARAIPGSDRVVCTLAGHHSGTEQSGEIAVLDRSWGTEETGGVVGLFPPRKIEPIYADVPRPANAWYREPYPLSARQFIVSGRPPGCERFGIYLVDLYGNRVLLHEDDRLDALSPMPLAPRPTPPVIPPRANYRKDDALVYMVDVYRGRGLAGVERGTVRALRIIAFDVRDTPETGGLRQENGPSGGHSCPVSALGGSWHVKRILGTVPVHEDGSALFRIPAEDRVFFQPVDQEGRALQSMRSWVEPMPGETISCVGCHESQAETPPARPTIALQKGPSSVAPWYGPPRAFGFRREVQPVLDRYCVRCHDERDEKGLDLRGDATNWFSLAYESLRPFVKPIGPQGPAEMPPPRSQGAVASPLVDMLMKGHEDLTKGLDPESLDRIITWIDLNIPYYDNTAVTRPAGAFGNNSARAIVNDAAPLWDALGTRCAACHKSGFRIDPAIPPVQVPDLPKTMTRPCVNFTHPEQSRILTAPLARAAGGLGRCGEEVFTSRDDPTYKGALGVIQGWHDELLAHPREDMPGFVPCEAYTATEAKRQAWLKIEAANRRALVGK